MTVLQELVALYDQRAEREGWAAPGFSTEKIGGAIVLRQDGTVDSISPLMAPDQKGKLQPRRMNVPSAVKRTAGVKPNLFWDKSAYTLGITGTEDGPGQRARTAREHEAFRAAHLELLKGATHPAMIALARFCKTWDPDGFTALDAETLVDQNLVFRTEGGTFLHELAEAKTLLSAGADDKAMCLVTGQSAPVARLHPSIKGVMGAQRSGAALVSFNDSAYESHGKKQGENAPVGEYAAFAYGTALNALLAKGSGNCIRIGDDTVAFWARGEGELGAEDAALLALTGDVADQKDGRGEAELAEAMKALAAGSEAGPLREDTRVFVLGLSPNAARLAVRYWHTGTMGDLARNAARFWAECAVEPSPFARDRARMPPKPWALLYDLAAQRDAKNIPKPLGGGLMRAILTGCDYPATLMSGILARLRVEGEPNPKKVGNMDGRRAAMLRAVLIRNYKREVPMALDETCADEAYLLGRLFAAYAYAERSYQERGASLRQKFMGAASATPARVFPVLMRGYEHNHASLRKAGGAKAGSGVRADRAIADIMELRGGADLPATLPLEAQSLFFIGFYHQDRAFYRKAETGQPEIAQTEGEDA
ncbi:type I-C CRISPR-associated protein Cas8c/Csd1 [Pontivivens insulae]|uniref:CRISPR-associated protein Csd1 n=1 Tax=Pontivivens insulae TaxID=1639689 RepID=A0A2R8AGL8_9RHOB|nr:type I-C CRISPR-associated protein Cas8c/Csd1 [Pontivivens insulae]RED10604.1 CRISPR-associated Csd1 family protein [Pontivivens insulae]SPF31185.1 hypothetical protein POI8812_03536 [Pontivivens insulae]